MRQSWRQWIWFSLWLTLVSAGCDGQLVVGTTPTASNNAGTNAPTVEVVALRSIGLVSSMPISVEVHHGDISVVALDATHFFSGAIFIEDDILYLDDITETLQITDKADMRIMADDDKGISGPRAVTHVRVPEGVALNLHTRNGSIYVAGQVGNVTASAEGGKIELRGQTQALTLTTKQEFGITVDGETESLSLATDAGAIDVTVGTASPRISVTTNSGNVLFSGRLGDGDSHFDAGAAGQITLMMPRDLNFNMIAQTSKNAITIQYPTSPYTVAVCATMNPGWPVDAHVESTEGKPRAQITVKPANNQIATPVVISGTVGPGYLLFHTTVRVFDAKVPDISDLALDQVDQDAEIPGMQKLMSGNPTAPPPIASNSQPATDATAQAQSLVADFEKSGGVVAAAVPLARAVAVKPSGGAIPMFGHNCVRPQLLPVNVHVFLVSQGGQIRILQMSPGN